MDELFNISFAPFYIMADDYDCKGYFLTLCGTFEVLEVDEVPQWNIINSLN